MRLGPRGSLASSKEWGILTVSAPETLASGYCVHSAKTAPIPKTISLKHKLDLHLRPGHPPVQTLYNYGVSHHSGSMSLLIHWVHFLF